MWARAYLHCTAPRRAEPSVAQLAAHIGACIGNCNLFAQVKGIHDASASLCAHIDWQ
jgi:hypothetical protein